jgi:hypothetical protein
MATSTFGVFSLLIALLSGGANDALDLVSTDAYWKSKNVPVSVQALVNELKPVAPADVAEHIRKLGSGVDAERQEAARKILSVGPAAIAALEKSTDDPDPEVASRVQNLIQQIRTNAKGANVRKLMAIRTLGELKKPEAIAALKPMVESKEQFVPDYAARAIAQIEGKPLPPRPVDAAGLKTDLTLFPANCGIVAQVTVGAGAKPLSVDQLVKELGPQMHVSAEDVEKAQAVMIQTIEQIGNVRIEGATFALADNVGQNDGFAVLVLRGKFDAKAVGDLVRPMIPNPSSVEGVEVFAPDRHMAFAFPSNDRAVAFAGPSADKLPLKEMFTAIRDNKGALLTNKDLAALIQKVDPAARAWAVCKVSDAYKQAPVLAAFDDLTFVAKQKGEELDVRISGSGRDAQQVASAVNMVEGGLNQAKQEMPRMAQQMPAMQPVVDFFQTLKVEAKDKTALMTGTFKGDTTMLLALPFSFLAEGRAAAAPPAKVVPVQPPPPPAEIK